MHLMLVWWLARLREPSTWRGIVWILTAAGVSLSPELWETITAVGMAVAGLIGVITRENASRVDVHLPPIDLIGRAGMAERTEPVADRGSAADQLRRPVRPIDYPVRHNTDEAADSDFPGWGS